MRYVLDSSVALKWVLPEPDSAKARQVRDDFHAKIHELLSPDFFPAEIGHALTRAERQGRIAIADGWPAWLTVMSDCPQLVPSPPLMPRAYAISSATRQGLYDCLYVALAEQEGCELVTADSKLIKNLQGQFPFIVDLATL